MMPLLSSKTFQTILILSLGAVVGANLRYWFGVWAAHRWGVQFPYHTLIINLTGSFILAFFLTFVTERVYIDPRWIVFFGVGLLGAYTTFSTFSYEAVAMLMDGRWAAGLGYLVGSSILGGLAAVGGVALARLL